MGRWSYEEEVKLHSASGVKDLDPDAIIPNAPLGAMLGQIGASTPFVVGDRIEFTATVSGPLKLVMNDWATGRRDNRGRLEALIGTSKD